MFNPSSVVGTARGPMKGNEPLRLLWPMLRPARAARASEGRSGTVPATALSGSVTCTAALCCQMMHLIWVVLQQHAGPSSLLRT